MAKALATNSVVLVLTEVEASVLLRVTNHIGGNIKGPRGKMDDIRSALLTAGVTQYKTLYFTSQGSKSLYMEEQ